VKDDKEVRQVKGKRGGAVKKAPPGYYTAGEAQKKLGLNASTFGYYVRQGKIKRFVPPLRKEGFYDKREIDELASELALFLHTAVAEAGKTEVRTAQPEDTPGIVEVLTIRGWKTATAAQRASWYKVNPQIDYVVLRDNNVMGYIHAVPYSPATLADMMSGKKRSWDIRPEDILPYESGNTYDLYIGIATRQDVPNHTQKFGFRLISGFLSLLEDLAQQRIFISRLYAVSAELEGQKLSKDLGFIEQPAEDGDLFPRFILDLKTSNSHFAKRYREIVQKVGVVEK
jgi:hypothetical protein